MARSKTYLILNEIVLPVDPKSYKVSYHDIVTEDSGLTEAGTTIRNTSRRAVPSISAAFTCTESMLSTLAGYYKNSSSVTIKFYDAGALSADWEMYISEFSFIVLADDGTRAAFQVDIKLEDFKDVSDL